MTRYQLTESGIRSGRQLSMRWTGHRSTKIPPPPSFPCRSHFLNSTGRSSTPRRTIAVCSIRSNYSFLCEGGRGKRLGCHGADGQLHPHQRAFSASRTRSGGISEILRRSMLRAFFEKSFLRRHQPSLPIWVKTVCVLFWNIKTSGLIPFGLTSQYRSERLRVTADGEGISGYEKVKLTTAAKCWGHPG